jgi:Flp pilus assembly protein TadG
MAGGVARRRHERRGEHGAAAVEFALVAPILLLLVFGIISYGYMLSFRQALSQGAAEGARAAAVKPAGTSTATLQTVMQAAVNDALDSYGVRCNGTRLEHKVDDTTWEAAGTCELTTPTCTGNPSVTCATVALAYTYDDDPLTPDVPLVPLPDSLSYTASVEIN